MLPIAQNKATALSLSSAIKRYRKRRSSYVKGGECEKCLYEKALKQDMLSRVQDKNVGFYTRALGEADQRNIRLIELGYLGTQNSQSCLKY